jgi:hypothetical protein
VKLDEQLHSKLTDELDRIWEFRKASNDLAIEEIRAVSCPTCGANAGEKCELHPGPPSMARIVTDD